MNDPFLIFYHFRKISFLRIRGTMMICLYFQTKIGPEFCVAWALFIYEVTINAWIPADIDLLTGYCSPAVVHFDKSLSGPMS